MVVGAASPEDAGKFPELVPGRFPELPGIYLKLPEKLPPYSSQKPDFWLSPNCSLAKVVWELLLELKK